ncbi:uncharacterized protein LOC117106436 [Anneissia japonica]|uniref:uncharacterized protein LOC117106436 n=1 Tax=Anneissia japonica TaxID=1529436 RepID=UPI001425955A|nr:uncharacterized protein LOC117106436 [Anneissia japonica]
MCLLYWPRLYRVYFVMRVRPFTFFLLIIVLLTVLNIIFVYESTKNATSVVHTYEHGRMLAENIFESRDASNVLWFPNETKHFNKIFRSNVLNETSDAHIDFWQRGNDLLNDTKYIPAGKKESINLTFQDLYEQLVSKSRRKKNHKNNSMLSHPGISLTSREIHLLNENKSSSLKDKSKSSTAYSTSISLNETYVTDLIKKTVKWYFEIDENQEYNHHCRRCALVTSSGRLLNQSVGADIDSADCVIRMNDAPVVGFEKDVGLRTDIRVMGHPNLSILKKNPENILEMFYKNTTRTKFLLIPWLYNTTVNKTTDMYYAILRNLTEMFPDVKFYVPSQKAMDAAETIFEFEIGIKRIEFQTRSTFHTCIFLFTIFNYVTITVFRLYFSNSSDHIPYHYYNEHGKRECDYYIRSERRLDTGHKFLTEKAVFSRWANKFNITFHTPSWNMTITENRTLDTPFIQMFNRAQERLDKIRRQRHDWRKRMKERRERRQNTPTEEPIYFLLFSVTLLIVVLKGCDIVTFIVTAIVPQSWQDL